MSAPTDVHLIVAKQILRYVNGTLTYRCFFNLDQSPFQPFLIRIRQVILMIGIQSLVIWSTLVTTPLLGVPRSKKLFLYLLLSLGIEHWPPLQLSFHGFDRCWKILVFSFPHLPNSGVTMSLPLQLHQIPFFMLEQKMWRLITTLIKKRCFAEIFKSSILPWVIKLLMFSTSRFVFLGSKIMVSIDPMVLRGEVKVSVESQRQRQNLKIEEEEE